MGAYHTLSLELQRKFTLSKDNWDAIALERVEEACDSGKTADLAAVVLQEGLAHVCLVRESMTITKAKIEVPIPRKRRGSCTNHDKVLILTIYFLFIARVGNMSIPGHVTVL